MAFDGIVTKAISYELSNLSGARIDKIFQPSKNNLIIGMYFNSKNYLLNICIDSQNCRLHLTTHPSPNPQVAPNFCMVLRKHLLGLHVKNIFSLDLERLVIIDFEGFDDINDIINKRLIIELMGKHSNVILLDEQQIIIDSLRHIKQYNDDSRDLLPHTRYTFPLTHKHNFLNLNNFEDFYNIICNAFSDILQFHPVSKLIPSLFNGICKSFIDATIEDLQKAGHSIYPILNKNDLDNVDIRNFLEKLYVSITNIINSIESNNLHMSIINNKKKDYYLITAPSNSSTLFHLNFFIDDFYYNKETAENFKNYRNTLLKFILNTLSKYNTRLIHIQEKLKECENMEVYRLYGELITANLYKFSTNEKTNQIKVQNYYDNQNELLIPLDSRFTLNENAKRYFKKYNKLKNALDIVGQQKEETNKELDYIQSVVYELETASSIDDLYEIFDEISENSIFNNATNKINIKNTNSLSTKKLKKSKLTTNKKVSFNPIKYTIDNYIVLVGRNNKENDYLTLKYAHKFDIWFHVKDFHGSHTILSLPNNNITNVPDDILLQVAKIATEHSKAKNSTNVPVDYCEVRYVKKPSNSKPGMVIYTNYKTIYV